MQQLDIWTIGHSDNQTLGQSDNCKTSIWAFGHFLHSDIWAIRQLDDNHSESRTYGRLTFSQLTLFQTIHSETDHQ
jgi:hypothetical protein